jgi:hypothetical protein
MSDVDTTGEFGRDRSLQDPSGPLPAPTGLPGIALRVLASSQVAVDVAKRLGLSVCDAVPAPGEQPVVVVIAAEDEVTALADVQDRAWVWCTIAWRLPEAALRRLYDLGVPVFVGLPTLEQVVQAFEYPLSADEVSAARSAASRLATIEALFDGG